MENATKALLIAGGVLLGVLIVSLGVYLYYALGGYITGTQERMEANAKHKFNTQFLKYIDSTELTIQDVITVANLANQNNMEHGLTAPDEGFSYYVTVNANLNGNGMQRNIEQDVTTDSESWLQESVNSGINYIYQCNSADVIYSAETGRIFEINFR